MHASSVLLLENDSEHNRIFSCKIESRQSK